MQRLRRLLLGGGGAMPSASLPAYKKVHDSDAAEAAHELAQLVPGGALGSSAAGVTHLVVRAALPTPPPYHHLLVAAPSRTPASRPPPPTHTAARRPLALQLSVSGMHCSSCSSAVESALRCAGGAERSTHAALPPEEPCWWWPSGDATASVPAPSLDWTMPACLLTDGAAAPPPLRVNRRCRALPGVLSADVALLSESADVRLDTSATGADVVLAAVDACGFGARVVSTRGEAAPAGGVAPRPLTLKLSVQGMHCSACSSAVEAALQAVPGVQSAAASLTVHQAEVRYGAGAAAAAAAGGSPPFEQQLVEAVEACGFEATGGCAGHAPGCSRPATAAACCAACGLCAALAATAFALPTSPPPPSCPCCRPVRSPRPRPVVPAAAASGRHDVQQLQRRG